MKMRFLIALTLLVAGCEERSSWTSRYIPTTEEERKAVSDHVAGMLSPPPQSISGDPDWHQVVDQAHREAREIHCRMTLWERKPQGFGEMWDYTGRWKYPEVEQVKD